MTSDVAPAGEAFVWIWLPGATEPVVAGRLARARDSRLTFNYGQSYLARADAIAIYEPELPLRAGLIEPASKMQLPGAIRDGSPDAWGRRVIINRIGGRDEGELAPAELDELTYLLESGSDRIGMLDFQASATDYVARQRQNATLAELMESAERVERGVPLSRGKGVPLSRSRRPCPRSGSAGIAWFHRSRIRSSRRARASAPRRSPCSHRRTDRRRSASFPSRDGRTADR